MFIINLCDSIIKWALLIYMYTTHIHTHTHICQNYVKILRVSSTVSISDGEMLVDLLPHLLGTIKNIAETKM